MPLSKNVLTTKLENQVYQLANLTSEQHVHESTLESYIDRNCKEEKAEMIRVQKLYREACDNYVKKSNDALKEKDGKNLVYCMNEHSKKWQLCVQQTLVYYGQKIKEIKAYSAHSDQDKLIKTLNNKIIGLFDSRDRVKIKECLIAYNSGNRIRLHD